MKNIFTSAILLLFIGSVHGQYTGQIASNLSQGGAATGSTAAIANLLGPISDAISKRSFSTEEFQGSPYVSNNFQPTTLYYGDEKIVAIYYRYNALNEEIEIKEQNIEGIGIRALGRDKKINILNNGKHMSFMTFIDIKGRTLNGYLTQLAKGETYDLYKRIHVKYTAGSPAANSFVKAIPSRFSHYHEYYIQKASIDRIDEISLKNRQLLKLIKEDKNVELKAYIKKNKLDIKKEQDLIALINYLNEQ